MWLLDPDGRALSLRASAGAVSTVAGRTRFAAGEGLMGHIVATRAPLLVPDLREDARPGNVDSIRAEGIISFAGEVAQSLDVFGHCEMLSTVLPVVAADRERAMSAWLTMPTSR